MSDKIVLRDFNAPVASVESTPENLDAVLPEINTSETEKSTGEKKARNNVHVVFNETKWNVKKPGGEVLFESETKAAAVKKGTEIAKELKAELFIHGKDGKIQNRNSHGNDPKGRG